MRVRKELEAVSLSFLDLICCAFGGIILLLVIMAVSTKPDGSTETSDTVVAEFVIPRSNDDEAGSVPFAPYHGYSCSIIPTDGPKIIGPSNSFDAQLTPLTKVEWFGPAITMGEIKYCCVLSDWQRTLSCEFEVQAIYGINDSESSHVSSPPSVNVFVNGKEKRSWPLARSKNSDPWKTREPVKVLGK